MVGLLADDPDSEIDYLPDQWDDSEQYPWDCDQGVTWEYPDLDDEEE